MPQQKDVDWRAIRAEYETTDVSDAALALRWGFRSATTIARKRQAEGWTRDVEAVAAMLVTKAVAGTVRDPKRRKARQEAEAAAHTQPDAPAHTPPATHIVADRDEQRPAVAEKRGRPSPHVPILPPAATHTNTSPTTGWDRSEAAKLETAKDLATIRAEAIADQLATADTMVQTGMAWLQSLMALAGGKPEAENVDGNFWPAEFAIAKHRLSAVSDKDTISTVMKSVAALLAEGVRIQREALGMTQTAKGEPAAAEQRGAGHRVEDVLVLLDPATLERLGQAATKLSLQRPAIEGQVEIVRKL